MNVTIAVTMTAVTKYDETTSNGDLERSERCYCKEEISG